MRLLVSLLALLLVAAAAASAAPSPETTEPSKDDPDEGAEGAPPAVVVAATRRTARRRGSEPKPGPESNGVPGLLFSNITVETTTEGEVRDVTTTTTTTTPPPSGLFSFFSGGGSGSGGAWGYPQVESGHSDQDPTSPVGDQAREAIPEASPDTAAPTPHFERVKLRGF
ncbi:uncharacterized protein [Procambarus clarkii]|nr:uncharacterized protein LOC123769994 [Procambarus clarkii]